MIMKKSVKLGLVWVVIIIFALVFSGCGRSSNDAEPEPKDVPAETEEIESIEFEEIEEIKAKVAVSSGSTLAIRESPGTEGKPEGDVIDRVPRGRVLRVIDKHGDSRVIDGYTWWEVEDTDTGLSGWSAADFLEIQESD